MTTAAAYWTRPPATDEELWTFAKVIFGVAIPRTRVCEFHSTPFAAFSEAYFARSDVAIWKASRGFGGKSFLLALLGLMEAVTLKTEVVILGGSGAQSIRVHKAMREMWNWPAAPKDLLDGEPTARETMLKGAAKGGKIYALLASQKEVRGPHPTRLRCDEIDEMDLKILDAALPQTMKQKSVEQHIVLSSTHQYMDGTFTEMLKRRMEQPVREDGSESWTFHEWCYRESMQPHGWLSEEEVAKKRRQVSTQTWTTEYEGQEPSFEGRAFDTGSIEQMFSKKLGVVKGAPSQKLFVFQNPLKTQSGAKIGNYSHGADWARRKDRTVIVTMRHDLVHTETIDGEETVIPLPSRLIAVQAINKKPWPVMTKAFDARVLAYGGSAAHDVTGIGDVINDYLKTRAQGFHLQGQERLDILTDYVTAVENEEIEAPFIEWIYNEHKYATQDDLYSYGKSFHLPDSVCAMAMAWRARKLISKARVRVYGGGRQSRR